MGLGLVSYFFFSSRTGCLAGLFSVCGGVLLGLKPNQLLPCPQTTTTTSQLPDAPTTYAILFVSFHFIAWSSSLLFPLQLSLNTSVFRCQNYCLVYHQLSDTTKPLQLRLSTFSNHYPRISQHLLLCLPRQTNTCFISARPSQQANRPK